MSDRDSLTLEYFIDPPDAAVIRNLSELQFRAYATTGMRGWSAAEITETMESPSGRLLVAFDRHGRINGFVLANVFDDQGEILILAVDPDCRRSNVATRLIDELINDGNGIRIKRLILEVAVTNFTAIAFYQILRFREIALRRNYYLIDGCRVDAQLMEKRSTQDPLD